MSEQKEATTLGSSAPTDEGRLHSQETIVSIAEAPLQFKGQNLERLATVDGQSLLDAHLPPLQFVIDDILPQGLYLLAGNPKVGKSWLSLLFSRQVSAGGAVWGRKAVQGAVLYLALEDSLARLQARFRLYADGGEGSAHLHFAVRSRTLRDGLTAQIDDFIGRHPDTRLVIIDTMQHVRGNATDKNPYVNDYNDMGILREITSRHDIALLLVTHTRKMDDPDPLNRISGSTGLVGAVDGVFILEKEERTANVGKLTVVGRDTEGFVFQLEFDPASCQWLLVEEVPALEKPDPLFPFLIAFMADRPGWSGTATELCALLAEYGGSFGFTPATLAKRLRANQQALLNKYGLWCESRLKNNNKIITITKESAQ